LLIIGIIYNVISKNYKKIGLLIGVILLGKILIVEDDIVIRDGLKSMIKDIDSNLEIITTGFASRALDYSKKNKVDAFLLDIQLEDYSGIKLAKEIRNIHCYDYIIKPFTIAEVKSALYTIVNHSVKKENENKCIKLKQKEYTCVIGQADIKYIESKNRKLVIETKEEQFVISTYTLKSVLEELSSDFIHCHKGFIVNTNFIKKIDKNNKLIYLKDTDNPIPIGRKYKENLQGELI